MFFCMFDNISSLFILISNKTGQVAKKGLIIVITQSKLITGKFYINRHKIAMGSVPDQA
jgi:hypothetical protein